VQKLVGIDEVEFHLPDGESLNGLAFTTEEKAASCVRLPSLSVTREAV
jgi:hypothetical protein